MNNAVYTTLGASNHSLGDREINDFYATDPNALEMFLKALERDGFHLHKGIWECACGQGHLSKVLIKHGYDVYSSDLFDRGYGDGEGGVDFLAYKGGCERDILTNPPYKYAQEFVEKALKLLKDDYYCAMFLKVQFLEGQARRKMFEQYPPMYVYVYSQRAICAKGGKFERCKSSAICYCWYIWKKGFKGEPTIRWI